MQNLAKRMVTKSPHTLPAILVAGMGMLLCSELNTVALIEI